MRDDTFELRLQLRIVGNCGPQLRHRVRGVPWFEHSVIGPLGNRFKPDKLALVAVAAELEVVTTISLQGGAQQVRTGLGLA